MTFRLSNSLQFFDNSATTLNASTNQYLLEYNNSTGKFDLVSADTILVRSTEDDEIPDQMITQLEDQINVDDITNLNYDGGAF